MFDILDLNHIYDINGGYAYSLPKTILESYISGKAFDNKEAYSAEESEKLKTDITDIYHTILAAHPMKESLAVMTAGAPGVGKTMQLRKELASQTLAGRSYAYICPDDVCLKAQTLTHMADLTKVDHEIDEQLKLAARQAAYNKWRPASNAATHLILANLIREKFAFYFGTTSSGPATKFFLDFLRQQGYRIKLIHISAPDDVRWESIKERDKTFVQTTEQDVKEKGLLIPQRINDFLTYADEIDFYYRGGVSQEAALAATWKRKTEPAEVKGSLQIINAAHYQKIKDIHNASVAVLQKPDLYWEKNVETHSELHMPTSGLSQVVKKLFVCVSNLFGCPQKQANLTTNFERQKSVQNEGLMQEFLNNFQNLSKAENWQQITVQGELALHSARVEKNLQFEAKICAQLTSSYFYQGNYSKAQICALRCHELAREFTDPSLYIRALYLESAIFRALAGKESNVKEQQKLYRRAIEVAKDAADLYVEKQIKDEFLNGKIFFNLGAAHADNPQGNLAEAARCYAMAITCFQSSTDDLAKTSIRLAKVNLFQKDYKAAQSTIDALRNEKLPTRIIMHVEYLEAQLKLELCQFEIAMAICRNGLTRAKDLGAKEDELRFMKLMQNIGTH